MIAIDTSSEWSALPARSGLARLAFALIAVSYTLYAIAFIYRTSFVVEGTRYFCLFDDAMISMCFARNFADGHGLVWTPGAERVEGFTNPAWVLYMALLHLLPVAASKVSLLVQLTSTVCLILNLFVIRMLARRLSKGSEFVELGAVLLTAFYLPLNNWALQGMEVGLLTLFVSYAAWEALRSLDDERVSWRLYVAMGLSLLVRIDMVVPCLVLAGYLAVVDPRNRWRHVGAAVMICGASLALQTGLRLWYYSDVLPNTYYLKMTGYPVHLRIARGMVVLLDFIGNLNWLLFFVPLALIPLRPERGIVLLVALFSGQVAYSVYTGGDAWEWWGGSNRFLTVAMPLYFVLLCCVFEEILDRLLSGNCVGSRRIWRSLCFAGLVIGSLLSTNALKGPRSWSFWRLEYPPLHVLHNRAMVHRAQVIEGTTLPEAIVAVQWAGIVPYFCDRQMIDLLGKNDRYVAHLPMHRGPGLRWFYPGHLKWDLEYSMGRLQPDVVVQPWTRSDNDSKKWFAHFDMHRFGADAIYLRRDSNRIRWEEVARLEGPEPIAE